MGGKAANLGGPGRLDLVKKPHVDRYGDSLSAQSSTRHRKVEKLQLPPRRTKSWCPGPWERWPGTLEAIQAVILELGARHEGPGITTHHLDEIETSTPDLGWDRVGR
jgi:hypothetical protein